MKRYRMQVHRTTTYEVEIDAPDRPTAYKLAREAVIPTDCENTIDANMIGQVSEPWVYGWSGDDLDNAYYGRPDEYLKSKDLLVFKRAPGNAFTKEDVTLLIKRVRATVGPVRAHWNGAGCSGLTIQLVEAPPGGRLTDEQVAAIMAPREEEHHG